MLPELSDTYIVYQKDVSKVTVYHSKIFHVKTLLTFPATITKVSVGNQSFLVKIVNYHISIALMACCENHQLKIFWKFFKTLPSIRSNVDSSFYSCSIWKFDRKKNITRKICMLVAVNKSFIEIKNQSWFFSWRQMPEISNLRQRFIHTFDVLKNVDGCIEMIFAKLVKTSWILWWKSVNYSINVKSLMNLLLLFCVLMRFEEIGVWRTMSQHCWRLTSKSCDIFLKHAISFVSFQLNGRSFHCWIFFFCLFCFWICFFSLLMSDLLRFFFILCKNKFAFLLLPERLDVFFSHFAFICSFMKWLLKILFNLD